MPIRWPDQSTIFTYIHTTHAVERIPCAPEAISLTYSGKAKIPNPYADGHLQAINYVLTKLVNQIDFPARSLPENRFQSELALNWVKDLHASMTSPLANSEAAADDPNLPQRHQIGCFRTHHAYNTYSIAPAPELVTPILSNWLKEITNLDIEVRGKLDQAYGITQKTAKKLEQTALDSSLLIATCQPFSYGNNRLGRLVENALRLHWRLPWKIIHMGPEYEKYSDLIATFQEEQLPSLISKGRKIALSI